MEELQANEGLCTSSAQPRERPSRPDRGRNACARRSSVASSATMSRLRRTTTASVLVVGGLTVGACGNVTGPSAFSPLGSELRLYGEWDVNGLVPDADVCSRARIDTIGVVFIDPAGSGEFASPAFRFPCGDGFAESATPILRRGTYDYRWVAYEGETVVLQSQRYVASESAGPNGPELQLMAVDFLRRVDVGIAASLSFATGTAFGGCLDAQVDTLDWELRAQSATGVVVSSSVGSVACTEHIQIVDQPVGVLAAGDYVLIVHAAATDGAAWSSECAVHAFESGASSVDCALSSVP